MNIILENKLRELKNAGEYECWYLVKQPTEFGSLCYLVSFLEEFKMNDVAGNIQDFIGYKLNEMKTIKPDLVISDNYRALRVAAFFGLITMTSNKYNEAIITDTFKEITAKCNGEYENTDSYIDIVQRQIEKMFISSQIDEAYKDTRSEYRLYPVMLLYKVLIELGRSTGKYQISMTEYRYIVATTKRFEGFLETLLLIKLLREDNSATGSFEQYRSKFDNRLIRALRQLSTLTIDKDSISIKEGAIAEVAKKVFKFEENPNIFATENYLSFLGSTKSLFELNEFKSEDESDSVDERKNEPEKSEELIRVANGTNILLYGVPGSGKSWTIQEEYCKDENCMERLVFHPDYMYSDFVGQIMPSVNENGDGVRYEFVPGPFTKIMKRAYENPTQMFYLVIEEINRGNAPAIFGEIFQLLDRRIANDGVYKVGTSEYGITNENIAKEMYGEEKKSQKVRIPSNLTILATMNSSDQNVFALDTAFQRRWIMRMIPNTFVGHSYAEKCILDSNVTWKKFCETINEKILSMNNSISSEDKRLGTYFITEDDLTLMQKIKSAADEKEIKHHDRRFAEKILKYLWDDAFKYSHDQVFNTRTYKSLEDIIDGFVKVSADSRFNVFSNDLKTALLGETKTSSDNE